MSVYSDRYTIQELKDMGESNRRHVLGEEKYNAFEDEVLNPKKKVAETVTTTKTTEVVEDLDKPVEKPPVTKKAANKK